MVRDKDLARLLPLINRFYRNPQPTAPGADERGRRGRGPPPSSRARLILATRPSAFRHAFDFEEWWFWPAAAWNEAKLRVKKCFALTKPEMHDRADDGDRRMWRLLWRFFLYGCRWCFMCSESQFIQENWRRFEVPKHGKNNKWGTGQWASTWSCLKFSEICCKSVPNFLGLPPLAIFYNFNISNNVFFFFLFFLFLFVSWAFQRPLPLYNDIIIITSFWWTDFAGE